MSKVIHSNSAITSSFLQEWADSMKDYEPEYVYLIPVAYKRKEVFFEEIIQVPARLRGAILTDSKKKDDIYFSITSNNDTLLYEVTGNNDIFDFIIDTPGRIKINFSNKYASKDMKVLFTLNTGQNPILSKENLNFTDSKLNNLIDFMKRFGVEFKFSRHSHNEKFDSIYF